MSVHEHLLRPSSAVSSHFTPSPASRSNGLPALSDSSTAGSSTPQWIQTPQSVSSELPTVKLPSYNQLLAMAQLSDVDMECHVNRFNPLEPPSSALASAASADPRATPAHCSPSFSYSPPVRQLPSLRDMLSDVLYPSSATHDCRHPYCRCQPRYHPSAPFIQTHHNFVPDATRLRAVSPVQTNDHDFQHTNIHSQWTPSPSGSSSSHLCAHSAEPVSSPGPSRRKPGRRIRREQSTTNSRKDLQATPRTTTKPARAKPDKSSKPRAKRLPMHPMPIFATLFPKGVRNYTGVPRDEEDERNYFCDAELMEMMPSGYQRWQDAVNRYKAPVHTKKDLEALLRSIADGDGEEADINLNVSDVMKTLSVKGKEDDESWLRFARKAVGEFGNHGEQLYHCKLWKRGGRCAYPQSRQAMKRHLNDVHFALRPWPCPFESCQKRFKQRTSLAIHCYTCHTGQTPFACSHCDAEFSDPAVRHEHRQKMHPGTVKPRKKQAYTIPYIEGDASEMEVDEDD